jgi:hypothetical protein
VLWGANMAEMHPMLWARIIDKRLRSPEYRVFNLSVYANRSSDGADVEIVFKPNTDLAITRTLAAQEPMPQHERVVRRQVLGSADPTRRPLSETKLRDVTVDRVAVWSQGNERALAPSTAKLALISP